MAAPVITIRRASFSYGDKPVWKDLDMDVNQGDALCILGANGCGKTTLLNCIHGDLSPDAGVIRIQGKDAGSLGPADMAKRMGYVFQENSRPMPYKVIDVVVMGRSPHLGLFELPGPADARMAENALSDMGILHLGNKRFNQVSGGERQLVRIARALCQDPGILLLDEPTSHLDLKNQVLVLDRIRQMSEKGLTIIMTSHFPDHAWLFSNRTVLMENGGIVAQGPAESVMTDANLTRTYDLRVRVRSLPGEPESRVCVPERFSRPNRPGPKEEP